MVGTALALLASVASVSFLQSVVPLDFAKGANKQVAVLSARTRGLDTTVSTCLSRTGYHVQSGAFAFAAAARGESIALIVAIALDCDGALETLARAASLADGAASRVLLCAPLEVVARLEQPAFDDFLAVPFSTGELCERVRRGVDTRPPLGQRRPKDLRVGPISVDLSGREVRVDGNRVSLTRLEFELLAFFCRHPRRTLRRQELLASVWGSIASSRTVDIHIRRLRVKLGSAASVIETQRGVGYKLSVDVHACTHSDA